MPDAQPTLTAVAVRPMLATDVEAATGVLRNSLEDLQRRLHHPVAPWTPKRFASTAGRIGLLRTNDPGGSFVAEVDGEVIGLTQAARREDLWNLCHFFVSPAGQNRGAGAALIERVLTYGNRSDRGAISSTPDPRAIRHYVRAGFDLHPAVIGYGRPKAGALDALRTVDGVGSTTIRDAGVADLDTVAVIDQAVRGSARTPDLAGLLDDGDRLLIEDDRGYVLLRGSRVACVAALGAGAARRLLIAGVAALAPDHENVEIARMVGNQQWALRTTNELGIELHPHGPLMLRHWSPPTLPFLPDASLC